MTRDEALGCIRSSGIEPRSKALFDAFLVWLDANPTKAQNVAAAYLAYEDTKPSTDELATASVAYAAMAAKVAPLE